MLAPASPPPIYACISLFLSLSLIYIYIYIYAHMCVYIASGAGTPVGTGLMGTQLNGYLVLQGDTPLRTSHFINIVKMIQTLDTACCPSASGTGTPSAERKPCWQIYAHGLHGYVGASARVAPGKYCHVSQWSFPSGATRALAPTYPCSPCAQICQHGNNIKHNNNDNNTL